MPTSVLPSRASYAISIARIVVGFMFLCHGLQKILGFFGGMNGQAVPLPTLPGLAGLLELVGGLFILAGLFTRPTAFILCGEMAVAYFLAHASHGALPIQNHGENAVLYCFFFLVITAVGPGIWSIDSQVRNRV